MPAETARDVTHSLPADTTERLERSLNPLATFPRLGAPLDGRWTGFRSLLGPWRWMLALYELDEDADEVFVVTIQDGRSSRAPRPLGL